jgi:class 3 adenylate cyclase
MGDRLNSTFCLGGNRIVSLADDVRNEVKAIFSTYFTERVGTKVPEAEEINLGNDAVTLNAAVLYADLAESTAMVNKYHNWFSAQIYKSFLLSACRMIRNCGGVITAFDGDRVMAVFIGDARHSNAATAALQINWAKGMINEEIRALRPTETFVLKQVVGVDASPLFIVRTGIRGSNDLVWIGRSANYAAKLSNLNTNYSTLITDEVYRSLSSGAITGGTSQNMWTRLTWSEYDITIYGSTWQWQP